MRKYAGIALFGLAVFVGICAFWWLCFFVANHLGFDLQSTPQYGFTSGIGPMLLTSIGMSTIITSIWHLHNCHEDGCLNIGKHRVNGSPYCDVHAGNARNQETELDVLMDIRDGIKKLLDRS